MERTKRRRPRATLPVTPGLRYTREACLRVGLGGTALRQARQSGMVTPIEVGCRMYYRGEELIAWIDSHAKAK